MEENQNPIASEVSTPEEVSSGSGVSFPTVGQPKKGGSGKTFLIIGTLILVAILGFVIFKSAGNKAIDNTEPTPIEGVTETVSTPTPSASASASPKAIIRSGASIEVQNGTGIKGDAAYLQTQLKTLGYTDVKTANAIATGATATKVTFLKTLSQEIIDEITKKLIELYSTVDTKTTTSATFEIVIITGLKKGATALPSASATPKATASASATPTPTPTATTGN